MLIIDVALSVGSRNEQVTVKSIHAAHRPAQRDVKCGASSRLGEQAHPDTGQSVWGAPQFNRVTVNKIA